MLINPRIKIPLLIAIGILGFYIIYGSIYSNKVLPNTYFANVNLAGKTIPDVENLIADKISSYEEKPIVFIIDGQNIETHLNDLGINFEKDQIIKEIKHTGKTGYLTTDIAAKIKALFVKTTIPVEYCLDSSKFSNHLDLLLNAYQKKPIDATIAFRNGAFVIEEEKAGTMTNGSKIVADLRTNLENLSEQPTLVSKYQIEPEISKDQAKKALEKVNILNKQKIRLVFERDSWNLTGKELVDILKFNLMGKENGYITSLQLGQRPILVKDLKYADSAQRFLDVSLDPNKLETFVGDIAKSIDTPTLDATLKFEEGKIVEFTPARDGRKLDIETTKKLILDKISINDISVEKEIAIKLPVAVTVAKIASEEINSLGIRELVGKGVSYFSGSIANRIHNISLGAGRISGTLVKPGEIFSFNKAVGEVSAATGYKQAYVISSGRTVLDDGGGICQVSTTVFRAALNAGLPIIARTAHAYRVGYYEQRGFKPGLDATVWAPAVDFQFKNDTQKYVLVQAIVDRPNAKLEIDIYGTNDGRKVEITDPVISNQKPPPPDKYQDDPTLPKGTTKQVDFSAWGATSIFGRKVYKGDELIIDEAFKSNYRPWQAVYLVGTGG